jgi:hypothetical protein
MVMEREDMDREAAVAFIEDADRQRQDWTRFLYGKDWLDPNLYDLVINLKTLSVEGAVEIASAAARRKELEATEQSRQAMADLLLESQVRATLAADVETASVEVRVHAERGVVSLKGRVRPASVVDAIIRVASAVAGVERLDHDNLGAPDYTV